MNLGYNEILKEKKKLAAEKLRKFNAAMKIILNKQEAKTSGSKTTKKSKGNKNKYKKKRPKLVFTAFESNRRRH
jgi:hypothetical protein